MRLRMIALASVSMLVLSFVLIDWAQGGNPESVAGVVAANADGSVLAAAVLPQAAVVCTGKHALCDFSRDCKVSGNTANCACWSVDEQHIVFPSKIQDLEVKRMTQAVCTDAHPCAVDQAPVCVAIKTGKYTVNNVKYPWVSTYSYRGWCDNWQPVGCSTGPWADCMAAPCTETARPTDPERPLTCQCPMENSPFVGSNGTCLSDKPGTVISTIPLATWDFRNNKFRIYLPGYEYVQGACGILESDLP